jgi:hypothetical protein
MLFALLAAPSVALPATPLESGLERGAFSAAGSFYAMASAGAFLSAQRAAAAQEPHGGAMLLASLGLLGLIVVRRLRALRAA